MPKETNNIFTLVKPKDAKIIQRKAEINHRANRTQKLYKKIN